ncbi:MAG: hypothetical protein ACI9EF_000254 [Pseudohongiellaceae bacterium]|jgi:hypothetical protein
MAKRSLGRPSIDTLRTSWIRTARSTISLDEFATLRQQSLHTLQSLQLTCDDWARTALHPEFGPVTLAQLLSTWVVHDLSHTSQIMRTMAQQYADQVGPWSKYISILKPV